MFELQKLIFSILRLGGLGTAMNCNSIYSNLRKVNISRKVVKVREII